MQQDSIRIDTKKQTFQLADLSTEIYRITNAEDLIEAFFELEETDEKYQDEQLPYWADLWHSAIALGHFLVKENMIQPNMKVTEIGCGLGFSGIVASQLGARVIFTDYIQEAIDFAKKNWELNEAAPAKFELMDWRKPKLEFAADLILAADVAYEKSAFKPLILTFKALCASGKTILLSDPNRKNTRPFMLSLREEGFEVTEYSMEQKLDESTVRVNIFKLVRN